jgi:D-cysteine desulfhydrase
MSLTEFFNFFSHFSLHCPFSRFYRQNQIFEDTSLPPMDYLVTASGSGGTHAGIAAAMYALRSSINVVGISTRHPEDVQTSHIHALADKTLKFATGDDTLQLPKEKIVVKDAYVGPGYSLPTQGMEEAVTLFARKEGILLDPVYTGKAAAGLIDLVRSGYFEPGSNVLFLHTGGAPSLYHYLPIDTSVAVAGSS